MRTDIRWDDHDPVAQLLRDIPRQQRSRLIRAIVTAALIPGGWAQMTQDGRLTGTPAPLATSEPHTMASGPPAPPREEDHSLELVTGMKPAAARNFVNDLLASDFFEQ